MKKNFPHYNFKHTKEVHLMNWFYNPKTTPEQKQQQQQQKTIQILIKKEKRKMKENMRKSEGKKGRRGIK